MLLVKRNRNINQHKNGMLTTGNDLSINNSSGFTAHPGGSAEIYLVKKMYICLLNDTCLFNQIFQL